MSATAEPSDLQRLTARLPTTAGLRRAVQSGGRWTLDYQREFRRGAHDLFRAFESEPLALLRTGQRWRAKPSELVTRLDERSADELLEYVHPLVWRIEPRERSRTVTLEWSVVVWLRSNEGSRVHVSVRCEIGHDPAWFAARHERGRGDIVIAYHWAPRKFPIGPWFAADPVSREAHPATTVWFPLDGPSVESCLGL